MKKILITGGGGYIGSVLTPRLLHEGYQVTVLDNFIFKQNSLADCCSFDNFQIINADVRDEILVKNLISKHDVIIPLAALVGAPICNKDPQAAWAVNAHAVEFITKHASASQWILMPVTNSGYGVGEKDKFCDENSPLKPISVYGKSKVAAEKLILQRENSISFRLATAFGMSPRMRTDLLVNDFVYRAVNDKALVIFEGHFKRNFIHVQDIVKVFLHGLNNFSTMRGTMYNVGLNDANLSKLELAEKIKQELPDFYYTEASIGEDPDKRDYIVSNDKINKTGFNPEWPLTRGIKELIKGYAIINNSRYTNI
ncbi:WcaG Nucleoside-diphosphate-sugar epimerases [Candidatus Methylopumilus universalis]|uniref:NAD-dependent epimerase/dehydratase family protein n=1 Tax=Candidatus Methylopumilus universalis TaxID=2588536 RepID=UPI003BEF295F